VETGSIKPKLAPRHAPNAGGIGDTSAPFAMAIIIGITIFADAVFDVVSLIMIASKVPAAVIPQRLEAPVIPVSPFPITSARPVKNEQSPARIILKK